MELEVQKVNEIKKDFANNFVWNEIKEVKYPFYVVHIFTLFGLIIIQLKPT